MKETFYNESVELTEFELDAVAGGNPFSIHQHNVFGSNVAANSDFANGEVAWGCRRDHSIPQHGLAAGRMAG
jgi:hypothetical protein